MIYIHLPGLPPSENNAYFQLPKGSRVLTKAGKKYKADTIAHIVKHHATETRELKMDATIGGFLCFGFDNLYVKSWPKRGKNRFVKRDLLNCPKLLMDAITEATAIDDSQLCFGFTYKYPAESAETRIYLWNEDESNVGAQVLGAFAEIIGSGRPVQPDRAVPTL